MTGPLEGPPAGLRGAGPRSVLAAMMGCGVLLCAMALNRPKVTDDWSRTLLADWEWFIPLDDPAERFASRQRIRTGLAFRHRFAWRSELVYIWTRSRDSTDEVFSTSDNAISFTGRRFFR